MFYNIGPWSQSYKKIKKISSDAAPAANKLARLSLSSFFQASLNCLGAVTIS
jgi:hypothetical protein